MIAFYHFRKFVEEALLEFSRHEISLSRDKNSGEVDVNLLSLTFMASRLREKVQFTDVLIPSAMELVDQIWGLNPDTTRSVEDILMIATSRYAELAKKTPKECLVDLGSYVAEAILLSPSTNIAVEETEVIERLNDYPVDLSKVKRETFLTNFKKKYAENPGLLILYTLSTIRQDAMELMSNDTNSPYRT